MMGIDGAKVVRPAAMQLKMVGMHRKMDTTGQPPVSGASEWLEGLSGESKKKGFTPTGIMNWTPKYP